MLIKNMLVSIVKGLFKSLFVVKKCFLLAAILATVYCVKKKFSNKKTEQENTQSIIATIQEPLPISVKVELYCYFQKRGLLANDVIKKIFLIYESTITRKNLLCLSFYQEGFIGPGDGLLLQSNPPQFSYCKKISLDSDLTAIFYPANPFEKADKDEIIIEENKTRKSITIKKQEEDTYIDQIYAEVIKILPHFQYETFQECQTINEILYTAYTRKNIDVIEKASKQLLSIQSAELRFMLFEQLKIAAYHFWFKLTWNDTQKKAIVLKTDRIIIHPHFFYWHINNSYGNKNNIFTYREYCLVLTQRSPWITSKKKLLEEQAESFKIDPDYNHKYIKYPHPFIIIEKNNKPLRMY